MSDLVNRRFLGNLLGLDHEDRSLSNVESLGDALAELRLATELINIRYHDQRIHDQNVKQELGILTEDSE